MEGEGNEKEHGKKWTDDVEEDVKNTGIIYWQSLARD